MLTFVTQGYEIAVDLRVQWARSQRRHRLVHSAVDLDETQPPPAKGMYGTMAGDATYFARRLAGNWRLLLRGMHQMLDLSLLEIWPVHVVHPLSIMLTSRMFPIS